MAEGWVDIDLDNKKDDIVDAVSSYGFVSCSALILIVRSKSNEILHICLRHDPFCYDDKEFIDNQIVERTSWIKEHYGEYVNIYTVIAHALSIYDKELKEEEEDSDREIYVESVRK